MMTCCSVSALRLFTLAEELGNVAEACRLMGFHRSTYYALKRKVDRYGLEALRVRERRRPRMPNQIGPHLEQRILAFALAQPGFGPRRISAELRAREVGRDPESQSTASGGCCGDSTSTPAPSAWRSSPATPTPTSAGPSRRRPSAHIDASEPGEKVQMDCFFVGRLSGIEGHRLAIHRRDVASGFVWAELHSSERNPGRAGPPSSATASPASSRPPAGGSAR